MGNHALGDFFTRIVTHPKLPLCLPHNVQKVPGKGSSLQGSPPSSALFFNNPPCAQSCSDKSRKSTGGQGTVHAPLLKTLLTVPTPVLVFGKVSTH